jgi:hypothetical protein
MGSKHQDHQAHPQEVKGNDALSKSSAYLSLGALGDLGVDPSF